MRKLTSEGHYLHDDAGGKREQAARPEVVPPGRQTGQGKSFAPFANDLPGRVQARSDDVIRQSLGLPRG